METTGERIKKLRESRGWSQPMLAEKIGSKNAATISKWESDTNIPRGKELKMLAELFNVSSDYILAIDDIVNLRVVGSKFINIPVIGVIACGDPITAVENIDRYISEPIDTLPKGTLFYLKTKGDSMIPTIPNGSLVLIREQPEVEDGEIAAVLVNGDEEATLKRVKHQGNLVMLMPDNQSFSPIIVTKDNPARILGKAIKMSTML